MRRIGRTPLFQHIQRAFRLARLRRRGITPQHSAPVAGFSRRQFLAASAAAVLAAYSRPARAEPTAGPKVAVIGAGIAGLNCTYLLKQAGFDVTLYEGSDRTGGRIKTDVGGVVDDITTEIGGEFIDTAHEDMLGLAELFELELIDTASCEEAGYKVSYYANNKLRTEEEVIEAFGPVADAVNADWDELSEDITFDSHSAFDVKMDRMTLDRYFNKNIKTPWLKDILAAAYINEFGLDLQDQSSLNFLVTIDDDTEDGFQVYGESDQRYKVRGGNQQIVDGLAGEVEENTELRHKLAQVRKLNDGTYQVTFDVPRGRRTVTADIVVLCLPFSILRDINLNVPLPAIKKKAIRELGYGINGKLIMGFQTRLWRTQGFAGDAYVDLPFMSGWDASRGQDGTQGVYTIYPGGKAASDMALGTKIDQAERLLPYLAKIFPGIKRQWLGKAVRAYWPANPWAKGSYSAYLPGQWTSLRGAEGFPVGNLYFAGEHTSLDWQGYMNGGAESGRLVAEEIIGVGAEAAKRVPRLTPAYA
jgi:monoamine oxidase